MSLRASIDLGTNTCLLLVADWDAKNHVVQKVVADYSTIVRLGQGVDKARRLDPAAIERTLYCLKEYVEELGDYGVKPAEVTCVATSQARDAQNGAEFFARVKKETGFQFQVISGEDEAKYSYRGALLPGVTDPVVIDIGGGSTELIAGDWGGGAGQSLDMGSVRFTERFFKTDPVTDGEFWKCRDEIDRMIETMRPWRQSLPTPKGTGAAAKRELLAVAGTATTLASWFLGLRDFDAAKIDQCRLTRGDLHRMVEELKWRTVEERRSLTGIEPLRADVLLAGAMILWRTMELLDFPSTRVSTRGLRFGVLQMDSS
ncbi:MAG: Ppx/GppA family phosphatase [Bacteriovoracia bacterium]